MRVPDNNIPDTQALHTRLEEIQTLESPRKAHKHLVLLKDKIQANIVIKSSNRIIAWHSKGGHYYNNTGTI